MAGDHLVLPPGDGGAVSSHESTTAVPSDDVTPEVSSPLIPPVGNSTVLVIVSPHSSEVGWPPLRRRSLRLASQTKAPEKQSSSTSELNKTLNHDIFSDESQVGNGYRYVKVKMDGMLVGRKVDLCAHKSFESLAQALQNMFFESEVAGSLNLLNAKSEFVLTYEDKDGGRMLAGDVPWWLFVSSVKRLQIVRNFEGVVACKRAIESPTCPKKRTYKKK